MKVKLPYALKNNQLIHISDLDGSGLQNDCFCPGCGALLIARKGKVKVHHFAHYKTTECEHALETALHLAAKEIILKEKKFRIPSFYKELDEEDIFGENEEVFIELPDSIKLIDEETFDVDNVMLEKRTNNIIPDLILVIKGQKIFVEIAVTHFIDETKLHEIKRLGISTIEIDLSKLDRTISHEKLKSELITGTESKSWIYNRAIEKRFNYEKSQLISDNDIERKLYEDEMEEQDKEERERRERKESNRRFYALHTKEIKTHIYKREVPDVFSGETTTIEKLIEHVSPCPEKKKMYRGEYYANIDTHCKRCDYFRGYFKDGTAISCLAEYYHKKNNKESKR